MVSVGVHSACQNAKKCCENIINEGTLAYLINMQDGIKHAGWKSWPILGILKILNCVGHSMLREI